MNRLLKAHGIIDVYMCMVVHYGYGHVWLALFTGIPTHLMLKLVKNKAKVLLYIWLLFYTYM